MPESEEYIRGMRAALDWMRPTIESGGDIKNSFMLLKYHADRLSAENAERRMKRIEWPDGGGL